MQLEAGKKYTDRRGRVYGPLVKTFGKFFGEHKETSLWDHDGRICYFDLDMDLVAEYVEPVQPEYRMLQDGETIQPGDEYCGYSGKWEKVPSSGNVFKSSLYVPHRRLVEPAAPVESPDDWVILDPVVYADHVPRVGIDQFQGWGDQWTTQETYHSKDAIGKWHTATGGNHTRCRRKDLPPVPPAEPEFPKYYVSGGVPWVYTAYVKRNSNNSFDCIEKEDGRISSIQGWSSWNDDRVSAGDWKRVTQAEAEARVTPKPKTRTVVLKEWLCWEDAEPETVTMHWCSTSPADETDQFSAWDNAVETGNTRTVEIPVT